MTLLARLEKVVEARGDTRSAVVERMLQNQIGEEEAFLDELERPLSRLAYKALSADPVLLRALGVVFGEKLSRERVDEIVTRMGRQLDRGKERRESREDGGTINVEPA